VWHLSSTRAAQAVGKVLAQADALLASGVTPHDAAFGDARQGSAAERLLGIRLGAAELRAVARSEAYGDVSGELRVWWSQSESPPELRWSFAPGGAVELGPPGIPASLFAPVFRLDASNSDVLIRGADVDESHASSDQPNGRVAGTCESMEFSRLPGRSARWSIIILGLGSDVGPILNGRELALPGGCLQLKPLRPGSRVVVGETSFEAPITPDEAWALVDSLQWLFTFWAGQRVSAPILTAPGLDAAFMQGGWGNATTRRWRLLGCTLEQFLDVVLPQWWAMLPEVREVYSVGLHILSLVPWQPLEAQVVVCSAAIELFGSVVDVSDTRTANPLKMAPANKREFRRCLQEAIGACMTAAADGAADPEFFRSKVDQVQNLALKPPQADLWQAIIEAHGVTCGPELTR
jgi:hypothetical protein